VQQNPRFEETCVNRPYAPSDEHEVVMAPTLQKEHRVDDSGRFLTYLFFWKKIINLQPLYSLLSHILDHRE
jgi:hypothetical protein